jgi:hypothetical protein
MFRTPMVGFLYFCLAWTCSSYRPRSLRIRSRRGLLREILPHAHSALVVQRQKHIATVVPLPLPHGGDDLLDPALVCRNAVADLVHDVVEDVPYISGGLQDLPDILLLVLQQGRVLHRRELARSGVLRDIGVHVVHWIVGEDVPALPVFPGHGLPELEVDDDPVVPEQLANPPELPEVFGIELRQVVLSGGRSRLGGTACAIRLR